jgi:hypothetical protein
MWRKIFHLALFFILYDGMEHLCLAESKICGAFTGLERINVP